MAIPVETNKELVVIVENPSIDVAISPPIIDSAIVIGAAPPADSRTLLYDGFEAETMRVRTASGLTFEIDPVGQVPVEIVEQMITGFGDPTGSVDGQTDNRIFLDTDGKGFYVWNGDGGTSLEIAHGVTKPAGSSVEGQIFIETSTNSFWKWIA